VEKSDVVLWVTPETSSVDSRICWLPYGSKMESQANKTILLPGVVSIELAAEVKDQTATQILRTNVARAAKVDSACVLIVTHSNAGVPGATMSVPSPLYFEAPSAAKALEYHRVLNAALERVGHTNRHTMYHTMVAAAASGDSSAPATPNPSLEANRPQPLHASPSSASQATPARGSPGAAAAHNQSGLNPSTPQHPNPMSPNSPASPAEGSLRGPMAPVDHKQAVGLLTAGQSFVMHFPASPPSQPRESAQPVFVFFAPSNGADSPGTLHWVAGANPPLEVANGKIVVSNADRAHTFFLNTIKQVTMSSRPSGSGAGASGAPVLTLFSNTGVTWVLEAS